LGVVLQHGPLDILSVGAVGEVAELTLELVVGCLLVEPDLLLDDLNAPDILALAEPVRKHIH